MAEDNIEMELIDAFDELFFEKNISKKTLEKCYDAYITWRREKARESIESLCKTLKNLEGWDSDT